MANGSNNNPNMVNPANIARPFASRVAPRLEYQATIQNSSGNESLVQIWLTTCIVSNFNIPGGEHNRRQRKRVLVNPGNPGLTGCRNFTYFPRGGPVPKETVQSSVHRDWQPLGYVSNWGGMEVGTGMMYPVSVIDGLVHQQGGWKLQAELQMRRLVLSKNSCCCPVGTAVRTTAGDVEHFDAIVHTTPPFFADQDASAERLLTQCYNSALDKTVGGELVALPLLGAGCRGFPADTACSIAGTAVVQWLRSKSNEQVVSFGLVDSKIVNELTERIDAEVNS